MSTGATLKQLAHARAAALEDASLLPQVMGPIVGLATECRDLPLQRWTARFIAESAAAERLAPGDLEKLDLALLPAIRYFLDGRADAVVWKASIQAAASLYPVVFRYM
jgi:symplekin